MGGFESPSKNLDEPRTDVGYKMDIVVYLGRAQAAGSEWRLWQAEAPGGDPCRSRLHSTDAAYQMKPQQRCGALGGE